MLNTLNDVLNNVDNFIWGMPLIILILFTGILLTVRLRGLQIRHLGKALHYVFHNEDDGEGEVTSFGALCTALSATIGTGNIVGCATAIVAGGPGALFWMWLAAFFGMATKYAEGMLAVKYRVIAEDGHALGGPFYYIEKGMGKNFKWLAKLFCVFGTMVGLFGIGTFTQVNGITSAVNNFFDPSNVHTISLFGMNYSISVVVAGIIVTICAGLVIIGGIKRISKVSEVIVPFMAVTYIGVCLIIVFTHLPQVPAAFAEIVQSAFGLKAVAGGAIGAMTVAMQKGIARGIFSNEAGLGSAPIAAAAAQTEDTDAADEGDSSEEATTDAEEISTDDSSSESSDATEDTSSAEDSSTSDDTSADTSSAEDTSSDSSDSSSSDSGSSSQGKYLGNFMLTGYCNCAQCCGTAGNATASGAMPTAGHTVAMAGVPFGTQLLINGNVYTVEDLGTPYGHVDIYCDSHSEALSFGLQSAEVYQLN